MINWASAAPLKQKLFYIKKSCRSYLMPCSFLPSLCVCEHRWASCEWMTKSSGYSPNTQRHKLTLPIPAVLSSQEQTHTCKKGTCSPALSLSRTLCLSLSFLLWLFLTTYSTPLLYTLNTHDSEIKFWFKTCVTNTGTQRKKRETSRKLPHLQVY